MRISLERAPIDGLVDKVKLGHRWYLVMVWFVTRLTYPICGLLSTYYLSPSPLRTTKSWPWYDLWNRFDGMQYLDIVSQGYYTKYLGPAGWFPGYPLLVKLFTPILDPLWAAVVVSNLCFLGALFCLYHLFRLDFNERASRRGVLLVALFPTAFLSTVVYSESTFLLFASASLLAVRKGWWKTALLAASYATLTRLVGVVLLPCLILERRARGKGGSMDAAASCLATLGPVLAFFLYLGHKVGDPWAYVSMQRYLGHLLGLAPWLASGRALLAEHYLGLGFTALALLLLLLSWSKSSWSHRLYSCGLLSAGLIHLQGVCMQRFMWVAFPLFGGLEERLGVGGFRALLLLSWLAQMLLFALWVQGYRTVY